ncbi:MAG: hypothetical protein KAJ18_00810 [Candidatus Omnitrophica bacterium]|nr:hypothetical protein [Candidatus Omnitrophota bacterium]
MNSILTALPFLISFLLGETFIRALNQGKSKIDPFVRFFLAGGIGLGLSAFITFFSFVIFNQLNKPFVLLVHAVLIVGLIINIVRGHVPNSHKLFESGTFPLIARWGAWIPILIVLIPAWIMAEFYPHGGWDAWQVWNFKAKFLFLAPKGVWLNSFDPILWRSSPHYPLLLPLINVWGWIFLSEPSMTTPFCTSLIFTALVAGLLFSSLYALTKNYLSILAPVLALTIPLYVTLATSQYADIVLGYFALAGTYCFVETLRAKNSFFAILSGITLGCLSFTKPEGLIAALIIIGFGFLFLLWELKKRTPEAKRILFAFFISTLIAFIPGIIFKLFYSPGNQTFINGFLSNEKPATLLRFKIIMAFLWFELTNAKWNGLWILIFIGAVFGWKKSWRKEILIAPLFLLSYSGIVLLYYLTNTYFEIYWWVQMTLSRILFSLIPLFLFWIFYAVGWSQRSYKNEKNHSEREKISKRC